MFCRNCGKEISDDAVFCSGCGQKVIDNSTPTCPSCGTPVNQGATFCSKCGKKIGNAYVTNNVPYYQNNPQDAPSGGFAVLGFFFPVIGLILYLVWKDSTPLKAKSAGKGALAGAITAAALTILIYLVYFIILASLF